MTDNERSHYHGNGPDPSLMGTKNNSPQPCADAVKALDDLDAVFLTISKPEPIKYVVPTALTHDAINKLCKHWPTIRAALTQPPKANVDFDSFKNSLSEWSSWMCDGFEPDEPKTVLSASTVFTIRKLLDLAAQGYIGVPEGYALVPIDSDLTMRDKGLYYAQNVKHWDWIAVSEFWDEMLKAAPKKEG